jgi:site-specific recombinase XerD
MLVSEAFEPYMHFCAAERLSAASTLAKYRDCFTSWILPVLGHEDLATLSLTRVLHLRGAMVDRKLSVYRMYSVLVCLKSFLKFCRTHLNTVTLDPATVRLPGRGMPTVEYLSNTEVQRVLKVIDGHTYAGARLRALVELLLSTGMRISEALSLQRQIFDVGASDTEIVGKGKRRRTVYFSERCRYWVRRYLDKRSDQHPVLFVTTGLPARPLKREDLSRVFNWLRTEAGIDKKLTPHILRHTFCTNLLHGGADITFIRDLAGHADIQTTARYYLGKNKEKLRQVLNQSLDYGRGTDAALPGRFGEHLAEAMEGHEH